MTKPLARLARMRAVLHEGGVVGRAASSQEFDFNLDNVGSVAAFSGVPKPRPRDRASTTVRSISRGDALHVREGHRQKLIPVPTTPNAPALERSRRVLSGPVRGMPPGWSRAVAVPEFRITATSCPPSSWATPATWTRAASSRNRSRSTQFASAEQPTSFALTVYPCASSRLPPDRPLGELQSVSSLAHDFTFIRNALSKCRRRAKTER
jgi:hypothetical protein